ncbi:MAG: carbonic anhydrase [Acidobacteriaceae bacterium]|nr:carbonic anhydrase [Acidobacteriaceae bacterium]
MRRRSRGLIRMSAFNRSKRCRIFTLILAAAAAWCQNRGSTISSDQALARLMEGNKRYASDNEQHPDETRARRKELESGQHPFAVILSCADSRVPPELIFDQGLGDLFVIRVAGNVAGGDDLASIEYAVEHLHIKLILVLGHEKCGAITAAVEGAHESGHLKDLLAEIQPSVHETRDVPGDKVHNCVLANARRVAREIRESDPFLRDLIQKEQVTVVAADYALDSGVVTVLDEAKYK